MPIRSPLYKCPKNSKKFCITAQDCREGKKLINLDYCTEQVKITVTNEAKPKKAFPMRKADWLSVQRTKGGDYHDHKSTR